MKKIMFILGGVAILALTSCRKDWTCKCTDNHANSTFYVVPDASFNDADNTCNGYEYNDAFGYKNCSIIP